MAGHITHVGEDRGRSTLHLHAEFPVDGPRNLGVSPVTIDRLVHEPGGTGELLKQSKGGDILPINLTATPNSEPHWAVFQSEQRLGAPRVRLALRQIEEKKLAINLTVTDASIPGAPQLCGADGTSGTDLVTRLLSIDDGAKPELQVPIVAHWNCTTDRNGKVTGLTIRQQTASR